MNTRLYIIFSLIFTLGLSSCTFQPAIDDQGNVSIRPQGKVLRSQGIKNFEKIKQNRVISHDPQYTRPVARVAKRLKEVIDMPDAQWEFVIFKDASPNAFALPGGKVGIHTGLFRIADTDALLAAVLGHEVSHATAAHAYQRMRHAATILISGVILYHVLENNDHKHTEASLAAYTLASYLLETLPLARRQEYESDRIGAIYMAKAGYDPRQSIELWRKLSRYHDQHGRYKPEFLRTHPKDEKRISALQSFMPIAMKHYNRSKKGE